MSRLSVLICMIFVADLFASRTYFSSVLWHVTPRLWRSTCCNEKSPNIRSYMVYTHGSGRTCDTLALKLRLKLQNEILFTLYAQSACELWSQWTHGCIKHLAFSTPQGALLSPPAGSYYEQQHTLYISKVLILQLVRSEVCTAHVHLSLWDRRTAASRSGIRGRRGPRRGDRGEHCTPQRLSAHRKRYLFITTTRQALQQQDQQHASQGTPQYCQVRDL